MWGNILASTSVALERTGDVLTQVGTSHIRKNTAAAAANDGSADPPKSGESNVDVNVDANVNADSVPVTTNRSKEELLGSFRLGWGSMVEATKQALEATRDAVEHQKHSLLKEVVNRRAMDYARTVDMPLDVAALKDADVVYVTDRIITMGHPAMQGTTNTALTPERKLAAISHLLQKRHEGRFMVWNLSEVEYDYSMLDDQVLAYKFPGSPSPPLGLLLKLLLSLESWLKADSRNVAVLHCLTGRGRTSTVLAAFLCWTGEAEFSDPHAALAYIARCKRMPHANALTIPSQRRYATYFSNMLDGVRPSQPPLLLKRILLSQSPRYGKRAVPNGDGKDMEWGCAPYLQIFKAGDLVTTAAAMSPTTGDVVGDDESIPFLSESQGVVSFSIETVVQGDILVRCRHLTKNQQRISMFRAALHTGYVPPKVLRLKKAELDGACNDDKRYPADFFIDLIFEPCDAATASQHLHDEDDDDDDEDETENDVGTEAVRKEKKTPAEQFLEPVEGEKVVTASIYDTMLHGDSRFWEVISDRRKLHMDQQKRQLNEHEPEEPMALEHTEGDGLPAPHSRFSGPTIGRRRNFERTPESDTNNDASSGTIGNANTRPSPTKNAGHQAIQTFSIGAEFDFVESHDDDDLDEQETVDNQQANHNEDDDSPPAPPKRDELMEALMALDDDPTSPTNETEIEEVVFEDEAEENNRYDDSNNNVDDTEFEQPASTVDESSTDETAADTQAMPISSTKEASEFGSDMEVPSEADQIVVPTEPSVVNNAENETMEDSSEVEDVLAAAQGTLAELGFDEDDDGGNMDTTSYEFDFDDDDAELEDLENFLTQASK